MRRFCVLFGVVLCLLSFALPLVLIGISIFLSGWFDLYSNALSDLGHSTRSGVAFVFNFALVTGGVLMLIVGFLYITGFSRLLGCLVVFAGYFLILVGVFDEVYGFIHFVVSVLFFVTIMFLVLVYVFFVRDLVVRLVALMLVVLNVVIWGVHFTMGIPRGAAIPELVSIFIVLPFYLDSVRRSLIKKCGVGEY